MDTVWKEYRKRKIFFWFSFPAYFCWMWLWSSYISVLIPGFVIGVIIVGIPATLYSKWKCPRCGNPFVLNGAFANVLATKCIHCGLPSYAPVEEVKNTSYVLKA